MVTKLSRLRIVFILWAAILLEFLWVQYFHTNVFPFSNYPMYSALPRDPLSYGFLCSATKPSHTLPYRVLSPVSFPYFMFLISKNKKTGQIQNNQAMIKQLRSGLKEIGEAYQQTDFLFIGLDKYYAYVLDGNNGPVFERAPCSTL